jgi:hypothetical protein
MPGRLMQLDDTMRGSVDAWIDDVAARHQHQRIAARGCLAGKFGAEYSASAPRLSITIG